MLQPSLLQCSGSIGDPGFMNPTGAPEPFWDFCEVVKGLFILILREHPVGVRSWVTVEQDGVPTQASGVAERQPKVSDAVDGSGEME